MHTKNTKILVIGGGIGGLTSAVTLGQAGFEVEVFERAPEPREIGAGIGLAANAIRVFKHFGLADAAISKGTVIESLDTLTWDGRAVSRMPLTDALVPSVCLHRADLHQVLVSSVPANSLHFGEKFERLEETDGSIIAHFASGRTAEGALIIGADGIRSTVRAILLGDGKPVYRGYQCWRGVCAVPARKSLTETFGKGMRFGIVPVGGRGTAWWCTANEPESANDGDEGAKMKLKRLLENWHAPIPQLISATEDKDIIKNAIYDRAPTRRWFKGRCALLGDAAHPMTPNFGQGGCMAIEDAAILAKCLAHYPDIATAFERYVAARYKRTAGMVRGARCYGWMGQWENPVALALRTALFQISPAKASRKALERLTDYDADKVVFDTPKAASDVSRL